MSDEAAMLQQVSEGLAGAVERAAGYTVRVRARRRVPASGVVWSADGLVVTADHVIEQDEGIKVGAPDDRELDAQIVGRDPGSDLALLRVSGLGGAAAPIAPAGATRVGHLGLAVGRPSSGGVQASFGVVSAIGGPVRSRGGGQIDGFLRTDTTFYPGFSGGPLVDTQGRVVGVNSSFFGRGEGLTIDAATVTKVVEQLQTHGRIRRAYLGVASQPVQLPATAAAQLGDQQSGLLIVRVEPGGPAANAGLMVGDILVAAGGAPVRDIEDLQTALAPERVGATVPLRVVRGGALQELSAALGERA